MKKKTNNGLQLSLYFRSSLYVLQGNGALDFKMMKKKERKNFFLQLLLLMKWKILRDFFSLLGKNEEENIKIRKINIFWLVKHDVYNLQRKELNDMAKMRKVFFSFNFSYLLSFLNVFPNENLNGLTGFLTKSNCSKDTKHLKHRYQL